MQHGFPTLTARAFMEFTRNFLQGDTIEVGIALLAATSLSV